jgi:hypothetical protein
MQPQNYASDHTASEIGHSPNICGNFLHVAITDYHKGNELRIIIVVTSCVFNPRCFLIIYFHDMIGTCRDLCMYVLGVLW